LIRGCLEEYYIVGGLGDEEEAEVDEAKKVRRL
jgi:hypothetical protein